MRNVLVTVLRVLPLALYLRSAACKFGIPIAGCDGALCPVAVGKPGTCVPTANTLEQLAWCEHAWTPWANKLLSTVKLPIKVRCSDGYEFAKIIGALELLGGDDAVIMIGAIHFHMTFLKDPVGKLGIQFALLFASLAIMFLTGKPKKAQQVKKSASTRRSSSRKKRN
ncbi:hypothetical protein BE221DRAFT_148181 [Ostreococcus tauri]|uniref:Uncharacterized protein n=1 Tax=Ostreococcus tauri TaxID=70448 RepID=A0A1Y5IF61_OSTTA|nr:hypothetical protein BE221DRAFT_148181 [Ostreococcus tauri]